MSEAATAPTAPAGSMGRLLRGWLLAVLSIAGVLRGIDEVPGLLTGTSRGVVRHASVESAEHQLRVQLLVPTYFPDRLSWPPAEVKTATGPPRAAALSFEGRGGSVDRLLLVQTLADVPAPRTLLPRGEEFFRREIEVKGRAALLRDIRLPSGEVWQELSLTVGVRRVTLRYEGPGGELLRMAGSLLP